MAIPKSKTLTPWANRIVGEGSEAPDQLLANPFNWRRHPKEQQQALEGMLSEVGWVQRVVVNRATGHIVDGHLRVEAAIRRGEPEIPVIYVELSEAEEKLVLAALDPIGGMAFADQEMIDNLLRQIKVEDESLRDLLDSLGSDSLDEEIPGLIDDDEVPEIQAVALTRLGETWTLGDHRLHIGDSTTEAPYQALFMDSARAHCLWTDPPYNVDYKGGGRQIRADSFADNLSQSDFRTFLTTVFAWTSEYLMEGGPFYIAYADSNVIPFREAATQNALEVKQQLVWVKNHFTLGRQDYQWQHESILYGWKKGQAHQWHGDFNKSTVLNDTPRLKDMSRIELEHTIRELREALATTVEFHDKPLVSDIHPTMKPVRLVISHLKNSTRPGDSVIEPFGGSGTTLIACEKLGRKARLIELNPFFADAILRRWQDFTGKQAVRDDGVFFENLKDASKD